MIQCLIMHFISLFFTVNKHQVIQNKGKERSSQFGFHGDNCHDLQNNHFKSLKQYFSN